MTGGLKGSSQRPRRFTEPDSRPYIDHFIGMGLQTTPTVRLDGLPPEDRALILDAAVLGQSFTPAALAAVTGQDESAIEPRIQALIKRELLAVVR